MTTGLLFYVIRIKSGWGLGIKHIIRIPTRDKEMANSMEKLADEKDPYFNPSKTNSHLLISDPNRSTRCTEKSRLENITFNKNNK